MHINDLKKYLYDKHCKLLNVIQLIKISFKIFYNIEAKKIKLIKYFYKVCI